MYSSSQKNRQNIVLYNLTQSDVIWQVVREMKNSGQPDMAIVVEYLEH